MRSLFLLLISVVGVSAFANDKSYTFANDEYSIIHTVYNKHQEIILKGNLLPFSSQEGIREVKRRLVQNKDVLVIIKSSTGGLERSFRKFAEAIKNVCHSNPSKPTCAVTMYVQNECASSCVLFYLHGDVRLADKYSSFGFHRKWMVHPKMVINSSKRMASKYSELGADEQWLANNLSIFRDEQVDGTWVDSTDLVAANIVHHIIDDSAMIRYRTQLLAK